MEGGKMSKVHDVTIAEAVEKMADWLTRHYHQRDANLARDPVAVYAQAQFEPDEIHCYQELNDWTRENSEVAEVFPEHAAAYDDLLAACKAAVECVVAMCDRIDEGCFSADCLCTMPGKTAHSQTYRDNELAMLTAAIAAARGGE